MTKLKKTRVKVSNGHLAVVTNLKYLNYMCCGPALKIVACFCNVCVTEKEANTTTRTYHFDS